MPASDDSTPPGRAARNGVLALTVGVFALVVVVVTLELRTGLRDQVLRAQADVLAAVATLQLDTAAEQASGVDLDQVPGALFVAVLKTAKYRGVLGVRVFDAKRALNSSDGLLAELPAPNEAEWRGVTGGVPSARLRPGLAGEELFLVPPKDSGEAIEA